MLIENDKNEKILFKRVFYKGEESLCYVYFDNTYEDCFSDYSSFIGAWKEEERNMKYKISPEDVKDMMI